MEISRIRRFLELKKKLFNNNMFVEVDKNNPLWSEYNKLSKEYLYLMKKIS